MQYLKYYKYEEHYKSFKLLPKEILNDPFKVEYNSEGDSRSAKLIIVKDYCAIFKFEEVKELSFIEKILKNRVVHYSIIISISLASIAFAYNIGKDVVVKENTIESNRILDEYSMLKTQNKNLHNKLIILSDSLSNFNKHLIIFKDSIE